MLLYFIIALFLIILIKTKNDNIINLVFLFFILLTGLRGYSVGTDTMNYYGLFNGSESFQNNQGEIVFYLLYSYLSSINVSYRIILFIQAILFWLPLYYVFKRTSYPVLAVFILYCLGYVFMSFNISRQMIAASIGLCSIYMIKENVKTIYPVSLIILSSMFHTSSLILLLVFILKKINLHRDIWTCILVFSFLLPFVFSFSSILTIVLNKLPYVNRFANYLDSANKSIFSFNRLLMNALFIFLMYCKKRYCSSLYLKCIVCGLIIMNLMPQSSYITRVALYLTIAQVLFFQDCYISSKLQNRIIVLFYMISVLLSFVVHNNGGFVPYVLL